MPICWYEKKNVLKLQHTWLLDSFGVSQGEKVQNTLITSVSNEIWVGGRLYALTWRLWTAHRRVAGLFLVNCRHLLGDHWDWNSELSFHNSKNWVWFEYQTKIWATTWRQRKWQHHQCFAHNISVSWLLRLGVSLSREWRRFHFLLQIPLAASSICNSSIQDKLIDYYCLCLDLD